MQLAVPFVAQIFMAASSCVAFQPSLPCFRELLSLLARLHMYPHVGLRCSLEIEILFNHLSLQLSDFQSSSEHCQHDATFSVHGMCEDECREHEESVWSSMEREASLQSAPNYVLPSDLCRMSLMKQLSATTTGNTMTAQEVSLQEEEEGTMEQQRFRGLQSQEIMEEQAKSGGLYSGLIDLDNLMDKGANKSSPQSKQPMAGMQQKGGAQPHPSSSTAQQQPNYNVSSSMGWGQSMGKQNPGKEMQNPRNRNAKSRNGIRHDANVSNVWTIWNATWHDRNRVWNESWNAVSKTTIN